MLQSKINQGPWNGKSNGLVQRTPLSRGTGFKSPEGKASTFIRSSFKTPVYERKTLPAPIPVRGGVRSMSSAQVIAAPKQNAIESEPYRRLVAAMPCIKCGVWDYSQAAHPPPTGKGIKEDDRECFPLCCTRPMIPGCHFEFDQYQLFPAEIMREVAAGWGEQVRKEIISNGAWPPGLPLFDPVS